MALLNRFNSVCVHDRLGMLSVIGRDLNIYQPELLQGMDLNVVAKNIKFLPQN